MPAAPESLEATLYELGVPRTLSEDLVAKRKQVDDAERARREQEAREAWDPNDTWDPCIHGCRKCSNPKCHYNLMQLPEFRGA